jgi:plastocyanin
MKTITKYKHEIMWWMSRLTIMLTSLFLSFTLASTAYATEIQMGYEGNLVFEPNEVTVNAGDTVTFVNNALPPHNIIFDKFASLSRESLMFTPGETQDIKFATAGDYSFKCAPHEGAGMKGVIHVQ